MHAPLGSATAPARTYRPSFRLERDDDGRHARCADGRWIADRDPDDGPPPLPVCQRRDGTTCDPAAPARCAEHVSSFLAPPACGACAELEARLAGQAWLVEDCLEEDHDAAACASCSLPFFCDACAEYRRLLREHEGALALRAQAAADAKERLRTGRSRAEWVGPLHLASAPEGIDAAAAVAPKWPTTPLLEAAWETITDSGDWLTVQLLDADGRIDRAACALGGVEVLDPTPEEQAEREREQEGRGLFVDVAAVLAGTLDAPKPTIARRTDGAALLYESAVNVLLGDPESGKSLLAATVAADVLFDGGSVLWCDLDHNGAPSILARLRSLGVPAEVLADGRRFRLAIPDDRETLEAVIRHAVAQAPTLAVVDSVGELLGLYGASPDSDQEFTPINRATLAALARAGACVVAIDHLAKGHDSRAYGASGTVAKKRAVDGALYRVELARPFAPGAGGKARLLLVKDRHGGVREVSPRGAKQPEAATFELIARGDATDWRLWAPGGAEKEDDATKEGTAPSDVEALLHLDPPPSSKRDVIARTGWGSDRAAVALRLYREMVPKEQR